MEKHSKRELAQRVAQLEELTWSLFRVLETYITFNDLEREAEDDEIGKSKSEIKILGERM